jgi:uncharacterized BrkB/YihY/UPF0761 family membrane protein
VTSSFGAAGSLIALLLWVYYSAQIFFLGAEFTRQYALHLGSLKSLQKAYFGSVAGEKNSTENEKKQMTAVRTKKGSAVNNI